MQTLEDVLNVFGSKKPFLKDKKRDEDGYSNPFTKSGSVAYEKLTNILYCVGKLTEIDVSEIIERLDDIANDDF